MPRTRNNQRNQIIDTTENNLSVKGISFNYSENFNHITELNIENFQNWKTNIINNKRPKKINIYIYKYNK